MNTNQLAQAVALLRDCCQEAGKAAMQIYTSDQSTKSWQKADTTPVTEADLLVNTILMQRLGTAYPTLPYLSEENKAPSFKERQKFEYYFLVDPLDGTKSFIRKTGEFSVNVALMHRDRPVAGCLYFPALDWLLYAHEGGPAISETANKTTKILKVNQFSLSQDNLNVLCSRSHHNQETAHFIAQLKNPNVQAVGASMKFIHVAAGAADLYPRFGSGMFEWDVAASQIIIECAGGSVIDPATQQPLRYNRPDMRMPNFIAQGRILS